LPLGSGDSGIETHDIGTQETTALTCTFSYDSVHSNNLGLTFLDVDRDDSRIVLLQYSPIIVGGLESPGPLQVMSGNLMKPGDILCSVVCNNTDVPFSLTDEGCLLVGENSAKHNVKLNFLRIRDTNSFQSPSGRPAARHYKHSRNESLFHGKKRKNTKPASSVPWKQQAEQWKKKAKKQRSSEHVDVDYEQLAMQDMQNETGGWLP
jgi:hypothetical protein